MAPVYRSLLKGCASGVATPNILEKRELGPEGSITSRPGCSAVGRRGPSMGRARFFDEGGNQPLPFFTLPLETENQGSPAGCRRGHATADACLTELLEDAGARCLDLDARIARLSSEEIAICPGLSAEAQTLCRARAVRQTEPSPRNRAEP